MRLQLICTLFMGTVIAISYGGQENLTYLLGYAAAYNFSHVRIHTYKKDDYNYPYISISLIRCPEENAAV
ncbi:hypothetical protein N7453_004179 [Penicillium expansum]|nr:hypothetical protein N7453_004179 [Penicillium expansum]